MAKKNKKTSSHKDYWAHQSNHYKVLVENIPQKMFLKDLDSTYITCNTSYSRSLGITPEDINGKNDFDFHPKDLAEKYREDDKRIMESGTAHNLEEKYIENGEEFWVHTTKIPIKDDDNQVTGILGIFWDITENKKAVLELQQNEKLFFNIINNIQDIIIMTGPRTKMMYINSAVKDVLGYEPEDMMRMSHFDSYAENGLENIARVQDIVREKVENAKGPLTPFNQIVQVPRADGRLIWLDFYFSFHYKSSGEIDFILSLIRDITDQKNYDTGKELEKLRYEAMVELNNMIDDDISSIMDYALDAIIKVTQSRISYIYFYDEKSEQLSLHAWSHEAMQECAVIDPKAKKKLCETGLWGEAIRQRKAVIVNDYAAPNPHKKGIPEGHIPLVRHMNVPVFYQHSIVALAGVANKKTDYDETDTQNITLIMDAVWKLKIRKDLNKQITDLNRELGKKVGLRTRELTNVMDALLKSEQQFRGAFEAAAQGMVIADIRGRFIMANRSFCNIVGYTEKELMKLNFRDITHTEDIQMDEKKLMQLLNNEIIHYQLDKRYIHKEGDTIWVNLSVSLVRDKNGKPSHFVGQIIDITQRKLQEQELRAYSHTQDVLLKEVNHRVKNNLTALIGMFNMEKDKAKAEGHEGYLDLLNDLIGRIRGLSVVHSLLTARNWKRIFLTELIRSLIHGVVGNLPDNQKIEIDITESKLTINSSQAHNFSLVLNELITNSLKHNKEEHQKLCISVSIDNSDSLIKIIYKDNGTGYPAKIIKGDFTNASIGMQLIRGITTQSLSGKVSFQNDDGAVCTIQFEGKE